MELRTKNDYHERKSLEVSVFAFVGKDLNTVPVPIWPKTPATRIILSSKVVNENTLCVFIPISNCNGCILERWQYQVVGELFILGCLVLFIIDLRSFGVSAFGARGNRDILRNVNCPLRLQACFDSHLNEK